MSDKDITKYNYSYVELEEVISNPEEYIIPQCLPACKALWEKNIETFMVSNNDDKYLYVLLTNISEQNEAKMEQLLQSDKRFFFDDYRSAYGIKVDGFDEDAMRELLSLTQVFEMQDTKRFMDIETYLNSFKRTGGELYVERDGTIHRKENPKLADVSLVDALKLEGKESLYIEEEGKIYESDMYLSWHNRYKKYLEEISTGENILDIHKHR